MLHWVRRHHRKIREIGTGIFLWESVNFLYDFLFYPFALAYWGIVKGGAIVVLGSIIGCSILFWLYDYMRIDWLGAHALRQLEQKENKTKTEKLLTFIGRKKTSIGEKLLSPIVFIGLTLPIDPLIVAIHYRKQHFRGLGWRDWGILLAAVFTANAWWLIKIGVVVEAAMFIWHWFF